MDPLRFKVAETVFAISSEEPLESIHLEKAYQDFLCHEDPHITLHAHYGSVPELPLRAEDLIFDSEGTWRLYRVNGRYVFVLRSPLFGPLPYRIAVFDADFQRGDVFTRPTDPEQSSNGPLRSPMQFPLSEVLMVCLLARGQGVMAHACGIDDGGKGYLFAGNSTHGKTTTSRLWQGEAVVLNDDRIVLRHSEGRFWMYGTPWHGAFPGVAAKKVPLDRVFFLRHADTNSIQPKTGIVASSMLLSRSFLPFWDEEGMQFTLGFYARLAADVPCYELGFVPDKNVVDFVRCVK